MPVKPTDDPRAQLRQLYADNQREFARKVDALLIKVRVFSASLAHAIGDISHDEAWQALRREVLALFDEHVPLRPIADRQLLLLVNDASRLLNNDLDKLSWDGDVRDWNDAAKPYLDQER